MTFSTSGSTQILPTDTLTIAGIDPGSQRLGMALLSMEGSCMVSCRGTLLSVKGKGMGARLASVYDGVSAWLKEERPDEIAVEDVFSRINVRSAIVLARVQGVILLAAERENIPSRLYPPATVKAAVTRYGRATKEQVNYVVRAALGIDESTPMAEDVSDAYAVALCHFYSRGELSGIR